MVPASEWLPRTRGPLTTLFPGGAAECALLTNVRINVPRSFSPIKLATAAPLSSLLCPLPSCRSPRWPPGGGPCALPRRCPWCCLRTGLFRLQMDKVWMDSCKPTKPNQTKKGHQGTERWHRKVAANVSMEVAANGPVEIVILPVLGTKEVA